MLQHHEEDEIFAIQGDSPWDIRGKARKIPLARAYAPPLLHQDLRLPDERVRLRPYGGRAQRSGGPRADRRSARGGRAAHEHLLGAREGAGEGVLAARRVAAPEV